MSCKHWTDKRNHIFTYELQRQQQRICNFFLDATCRFTVSIAILNLILLQIILNIASNWQRLIHVKTILLSDLRNYISAESQFFVAHEN